MLHMPYQPEVDRQITRSKLLGLDYNFSLAFHIALGDQKTSFLCEQIVRVIPGKRLVTFGSWQNKKVVAKIFFGKHAKQHLERELKGADALVKARIPTPEIYYSGTALQDKQIHVLIFERIVEGQDFSNFWLSHKNLASGEAALKDFVVELATQHVIGVLQDDLHLKNFLISYDILNNKYVFHTLDGASIRRFPNMLTKKQSLENLALFFFAIRNSHSCIAKKFISYLC